MSLGQIGLIKYLQFSFTLACSNSVLSLLLDGVDGSSQHCLCLKSRDSGVAARVAISERMVWLAVGAYILYSTTKNEADVTRISADIATSLI